MITIKWTNKYLFRLNWQKHLLAISSLFQATWLWFTEHLNYENEMYLVKKLFDTQWSFQATWNWITEHSNYENEMYLLWTNILNKGSKPHDSGSQNIQDMEMKCSSCEKTFSYVLNEASKPHETESLYFLDPKNSNSLFYLF